MRAAVCTAYGGPDVVVVRDVETPVAADDEILVRVRATTISSGDSRVRGSNFPPGFTWMARLIFGVSRPRQPILGGECAGIVEAAGAQVTQFRAGDAVIALTGARFGCHAEVLKVRASGAVVSKPAGISFEQAASLAFGGTTALHFLREPGKLQAGERVLINGASGAVGIAAVQLAKHFGAHVTGICSAANADLVRSFGADAVIDYKTTDFTGTGERWDVIMDTVGNLTFAQCRGSLNAKGRLLLVAAGLGDLLKAPLQSMTSGLSVAGGAAPERAEDLALLAQLCEAGTVKPVIDSRYAFTDIGKAHARTDTGRKAGSVVVVFE